jgi:hypothetical protein
MIFSGKWRHNTAHSGASRSAAPQAIDPERCTRRNAARHLRRVHPSKLSEHADRLAGLEAGCAGYEKRSAKKRWD